MSEDSQSVITLTMEESPERRQSRPHNILDAPALVQLAESFWAPCMDLTYAVTTDRPVLMCPPGTDSYEERRNFYETALLQDKVERLPEALREASWLKSYQVRSRYCPLPWDEKNTNYTDVLFAPPTFIVEANHDLRTTGAQTREWIRQLSALGEFYYDGYITDARALFLKLYGYELNTGSISNLPEGLRCNFVKVVFDADLAAKHKKRADARDAPRPAQKQKKGMEAQKPVTPPPGPALTICDLDQVITRLSRSIPNCDISSSVHAHQSWMVRQLGYVLDLYARVHSPELLIDSDPYRFLVQTFGRAVKKHEKKFAEEKQFLAWLRAQIRDNTDWREWPVVDRNRPYEWAIGNCYEARAFGGIQE